MVKEARFWGWFCVLGVRFITEEVVAVGVLPSCMGVAVLGFVGECPELCVFVGGV